MMDIRLLGTPRVFLDDEQLQIQRKATRSLFFFLAMHPNGVDRGKLAELFGGKGDDEGKKRTNLRRLLNHVRNINKGVELVQSYHDSVSLNPDLIKVDLLRLQEIAAEIKQTGVIERRDGHTLPYSLYQQVLEFSDLLNEERFCDCADFDWNAELSQWKTTEDGHFKKIQGVLFAFMAEMDTLLGNPQKGYSWAERALQCAPSEKAHYYQLKSLRDMGKTEKARNCYLELLDFHGRGLSERVRRLGEEILDMEEASPSRERPEWPIRPSVPAPFVGRKEVLKRIKANYQRGVGTLLTAEAGMGKTRLVQEFYETIPLTPKLLQLSCYRDSENLPYQPWIDMLRQSFDEEFWQSTPAWWTRPLTMLLPEIIEYRDDLDVKAEEFFANVLVFDAFKNFLNYVNQQQASLLYVDDTQWMDRVSFALLKYLIMQSTFRKWNIGLVATSRLGMESGVEHFEFDALQGKLDEVEITGLSDEDVKYLAFYLLNEDLTEEKIAYLQKMTGGNPFFLLELLNFHATHDSVNIFEPHSIFPPSLKHLINMRLMNISPLARKVLSYSAIQGDQFTLSILEEVLGISQEEMVHLITELEDARLVQFLKKDRELYYRFLHETIREEIIHSLSAAEKRMLHAEFSNAMAQKEIYQTELAAVLAEHHEEAGEYQEAFWVWHQAAKHAYRVFSLKDSYAAFLRAEKLLPRVDLLDEDMFRFYMSWVIVLFNSGQPDEIETVMERLLRLGEKRGSRLLIGAALDGKSDAYMARNQFDKGLEYVEEALGYLIMDAHIPGQMNALIHQGVFQYKLNRFPESLDSFRTVLSLGKGRSDLHSIYVVGKAHYQIAFGMVGTGYPRKALEHGYQSLHHMRLSTVPYSTILPYGIIGLAKYYLGEYLDGKESALRSLDLAKQADSWRILGYSIAYAGMNETELPELGPAWQHAREAITYGEKYGHTEIVSMGYKIMGDIYARLEAPTKAVKAYQQGLAVDDASFVSLENAARLGMTLGMLGDPKGDAILEEAFTHARAAGLEVIDGNARALQLSLFIAREDYDLFDANVEDIQKIMIERSHPKSYVWVDYLRARRFFQKGNPEEAMVLLEETLRILDETLFFWIRIRAQRLHLEVLKALGRDPARSHTKLLEMLAVIEAGLKDAPLQEEFQVFSERMKAL